ncbi:ferredoxin family protein [Natranaerobius thermophilus]|uniref:4Fe-4S ferredoxin iron-sulfur binding domain protein n=1 Tax=Natranaerobius thermophilus (strain ATCC BAA-1301 / DSM 18059 / JW/NM-WN-LF) TaxID=457570 RepID=B2A3V2_NATTJ|nr:4Fe-4S dicluster domain-containing protein [Natranaerobius thermophilus]ACB83727.1 4Fe-4S ferredoxin iron-sulfur binding domain protein [Natranaerobius thermophilus JW/NM-WN-LF]
MDSRNLNLRDMVQFVTIVPDSQTHIYLKEPNLCADKCDLKPCTYICPSHVYYFDDDNQQTLIDYKRCIECGACIYACPLENIDWHFPRPGYGIFYKY